MIRLFLTAKELDKSATTEWWTNSDAKNYRSRLACLREHYNGYNVDGQQTIVENIADNVGLELSFRAYRRNRKVDRAIPFLENYSWDQLFFIGYTQVNTLICLLNRRITRRLSTFYICTI